MLAPGPAFYCTPGADADGVRIAHVLGEQPLAVRSTPSASPSRSTLAPSKPDP